MGRWLTRIATIAGTAIGAFAGLVAVQLLRLRRMQFLPGHPGFIIDHIVPPTNAPGTGPNLRLAVFGDSTTAGVGVERPGDALPYVLARHLANAEERPVHVVSFGWAGARIADLPRSQLPRALKPWRSTDRDPFLPGADAVAIVIGSNDATHNTPPARFRADLRATLEAVHAAAPNARIVLAGIPAFRGALRAIEPLIFLADQYARLLRPIGRAEAQRIGAAYADLAAEVPDRIRGRTDVLSSDRFHPSAVGYAAWADVIAEALLEGPASQGESQIQNAGA